MIHASPWGSSTRRANRARFDHVPRDVRIGGRVFHQGKNSARHETSRANRDAATGHLRNRDKTAPGLDLDPATIPGRDDVVGADLAARINHDLHSIAPHTFTVRRLDQHLRRGRAVRLKPRQRLRRLAHQATPGCGRHRPSLPGQGTASTVRGLHEFLGRRRWPSGEPLHRLIAVAFEGAAHMDQQWTAVMGRPTTATLRPVVEPAPGVRSGTASTHRTLRSREAGACRGQGCRRPSSCGYGARAGPVSTPAATGTGAAGWPDGRRHDGSSVRSDR